MNVSLTDSSRAAETSTHISVSESERESHNNDPTSNTIQSVWDGGGKIPPVGKLGLGKLVSRVRSWMKRDQVDGELFCGRLSPLTDSEAVLRTAEWVNSRKVRLDNLALSLDELMVLAPHLEYIEFENLPGMVDWEADSLQNFLDRCSNVRKLRCAVGPSVALRLPSGGPLDSVRLTSGPNLESVDLTAVKELNQVTIRGCGIRKLVIDKAKNLYAVTLEDNPNLRKVSLGKRVPIQFLQITRCPIQDGCHIRLRNNLRRLCIHQADLRSLDLRGASGLCELELGSTIYLKQLLLGQLPHLDKISLERCLSLSRVVQDLSFLSERSSVSECPLLTYRFLENIRAIDGVQWKRSKNQFYVSRRMVQTTPFKILKKLDHYAKFRSGRMPGMMVLNELTGRYEDGVDLGGLSRTVVTWLGESLFNGEHGFCCIGEKGSRLIQASQPLSHDEVCAWIGLGKLIGCCLQAGSRERQGVSADCSLRMGTHLSPHFFSALLSLTDEEIERVALFEELPNDLVNKIYSRLYGYEEEYEAGDCNAENPVVLPLLAVAKGFKTVTSSALRNTWRTNGEQAFMKKVQGEAVQPESLKAAIEYEVADGVSPEESSSLQRFLEDWITRNGKRLPDFLELVTGARTLGEQPVKVEVYSASARSVPFMRTCFRTIELPASPTQAHLDEMIDKAFLAANTFQMA